MATLKTQDIPLLTFQTPPATAFYRVHDPKNFGDDVTNRSVTAPEALKTGRQIVGVEPGRDVLSIFGMTPVMRDGKVLANPDIGISFGKDFVGRIKRRFGIVLVVHWSDGHSFKRLSSSFGDEVVASQDELRRVFDGAVVNRHAGRSSRGTLCRADQELRRPADRLAGGDQGYHRL